MIRYELYGTADCPHTRDLKEWLELRRAPFTEYDIDVDRAARDRFRALPGRPRMVPVLIADGRVVEVGWQGRGCPVGE